MSSEPRSQTRGSRIHRKREREREEGKGTLVIVLSFASSFRCSFFPFAAAVDDDIDGEEEDHVVLFQHVIHVPQFFSLGFLSFLL